MNQSADDVLRRAKAYLQIDRPQLARPMLVEYVRLFLDFGQTAHYINRTLDELWPKDWPDCPLFTSK